MRKKLIVVFAVMVIALTAVVPAGAITGGQPDGNRHPYGALLLVPGITFCSGTLIDEDLVLTAGHCTFFWSNTGDPELVIDEVWVSFDSEASVDPATWEITGGTWYRSDTWFTHPDYVNANWPFTSDYGAVILDEPVAGITPASLPDAGLVDELIGTTGQTSQRFNDVGYGQAGVLVGGGPYIRNFEFVRKFSVQRYNPSNGSVGTQDPRWLILGDSPSPNKGAGCGGDSGSGIFPENEDTVVAVHTGGYRLGYLNRLCGRITALNHRVDLPVVLDWLATFLD
ncbi:MAG TPA: trypsin-like serine protease [Anaerolineales bacterium]|nr:trypsin-like serine protease [Anaerolineales bacterium]